MKKSLIILPIVAMLFTGCTQSRKSPKKKSTSTQTSSKTTSGNTSGGQLTSQGLPPQDPLDFGPEEFNGYRRVMHAPENDKEYLFGFYHVAQSKFFFMNGHHHTDDKGEYPFYQSTTNDVSKAVKLVCHYASDNQHYSIQIKGGGEYTTYDGKYLEIYEGTKDAGGKVTTIRQVDSPVESFYYAEVEGNYNIKTSAIKFEATRTGRDIGIFACSGADYVTVSGIDQQNYGNGYICHFWEPIA